MTLYYAIGGGMGHLVRASAFLQHLDISDYRILTASSLATHIFPEERIIRIGREFEGDREGLRRLIVDHLESSRALRLIMDCFPHGILGELPDPGQTGEVECWYVTRRLRWDRYQSKTGNEWVNRGSGFDRTFILEEPETGHLDYMERVSRDMEWLTLPYPSVPLPETLLKEVRDQHVWLIVHAGNHEELDILVTHAREVARAEGADPKFMLIAPQPWLGITCRRFFPAHVLFPYAEKIFTACGFNVMAQARDWRDKHIFIPFERKYDDQFWRAARAKKNRPD